MFKVSSERFAVLSKTIIFNVAEQGSPQSMESQTGKLTLNAGNSERPIFQLCLHDCGNVLANDASDQS